jgi:hypothetical protein
MINIIYVPYFHREFDETLLRKFFEVYYENDVTDLPYSPDVSDYLLSEVNLFLN